MPFVLGLSLVFLFWILIRRKMLTRFIVSGILGLLCCVAAVCVAPGLSIDFAFNAFTAAVSFLLGPAGAAGMLALALIWEM